MPLTHVRESGSTLTIRRQWRVAPDVAVTGLTYRRAVARCSGTPHCGVTGPMNVQVVSFGTNEPPWPHSRGDGLCADFAERGLHVRRASHERDRLTWEGRVSAC